MANSYLTRTPSSNGNKQIFTFSTWLKRSKLGVEMGFFTGGSDANVDGFFTIQFKADDALNVQYYEDAFYNITPNRKFRDTSAWYHIVVAMDSTQGTASNRTKIYVNGVQETSFADAEYPNTNFNFDINETANPMQIGVRRNGSAALESYFDGYLSHISWVDGQQLAPTVFGETDSTSGIWKFKQPSGVTWGTNGFHLKFENSGNLGLDSSGNSNTFTVNGNGRQALDTPSNVYATLNPLDKGYTGAITLANGNNTIMSSSSFGDYGVRSTLGVSKGKWYWEVKNAAVSGNGANTMGVLKMDKRLVINLMANPATADVFGIQRHDDTKTNIYSDGTFTSQNTAMWGGITTSDVISFALDMDNGKLYLAKNGAFKDSSGNTGNPATAAYPTFTGIDSGEYYGFYSELRMNNDNGLQVNFGNGYFGTTAISSAGSNGNGSLFEYDVPSGYYALNTKNINTYG